MSAAIALLAGVIFGIGLIAGGMTDPAKVKGFLDLAGAWDPSLSLVMGGAIAVASAPSRSPSAARLHGPARRSNCPPAPPSTRGSSSAVCCSASAGASAASAPARRWWRWPAALARRCGLYRPCWSAWRCTTASSPAAAEAA